MWDAHWPGRYQAELAAFQQANAPYSIDQAELAQGRLLIDVEWPMDGTVIRLRARYPDSFPRFRPQVQLLSPPSIWPRRHVSPLDGNLCLLGRDSAQWNPEWTLARLLDEKLKEALAGSPDEDTQGEPVEYWWNLLAHPDKSFVLVDSDWDLKSASSGTISFGLCGSEGPTPSYPGRGSGDS